MSRAIARHRQFRRGCPIAPRPALQLDRRIDPPVNGLAIMEPSAIGRLWGPPEAPTLRWPGRRHSIRAAECLPESHQAGISTNPARREMHAVSTGYEAPAS